MKVITYQDLTTELKQKSRDVLLQHLLTQPSIAKALPDLTKWKCTTADEANLEENFIEVARLQKALIEYLAKGTPPLQLSEKDLSKLIQALVYVLHNYSVFILFTQEQLTSEYLLQTYITAQKVLPTARTTKSANELGLEDLSIFMLAALRMMNKIQISWVLNAIKKMVDRSEELTNVSVVHENADDDSAEDSDEVSFANGERNYHLTTLEMMGLIVAKEYELSEIFNDTTATALNGMVVADPNWAATVINALKRLKKDKLATNTRLFAYELPPARIHEYMQLQKDIATLIPAEYERPTIALRLRGMHRSRDEQLDLGLLGGMGPLSDAHIISQLLSQGDPQNANILLVSSPPVRNEEKEQNGTRGYHAHKSFRMKILHELRWVNCKQYAMLSNTAHLHRQGFKFITGDLISILLGSGRGTFINSVKEIAEVVVSSPVASHHQRDKKVMILGTTEAAVGDLYLSLLRTQNSHYHFGTLTPSATQVPEEQAQLQRYIDAAKTSPEATQAVAVEFISALTGWITRHSPTHVLLACTEIPLLLQCQVPGVAEKMTVLQSLEEVLEQQCPKWIDSEVEMINILSNSRKRLEADSPIGKIIVRLQALQAEILTDSKGANEDRTAVLFAISQALNNEDRQAAIRDLDAATKKHKNYNKVKTVFFGEQSATSIAGWLGNTVGTTSSQQGQLIDNLIYDVKLYLQNFSEPAPAQAQTQTPAQTTRGGRAASMTT